MSSRALRKLHGNQDLDVLENGKSTDDEEEDVDSEKRRSTKKNRKPQNPFLLLGEEEEEDDNEENVEENTPQEQVFKSETGVNRKKKKKKKKKKKSAEKDIDNEDDEIEASIKEVNRILENSGLGAESITKADNVNDSNKALLTVEHKNLNPDNELKRIFGSRVIQAETSRRRQRNMPMRRRASWLATPKDTWPHIGKTGLTMSLKETQGNVNYFVYEHNHQYQQVQFQFYDAVESLNPQNIMDIVRSHPYHVDSLIQMSEVFRMNEDMQTAADLIERALFSFEMSFHSLFSLTTGNSRLDFKQAENRPFYLALFKHLVNVGQRGCYRTALEFCKLLLSLDPDNDPMCILLMIDFYALRAAEYAFLIRLYQEWEDHRNLSQLPNFAFSVPLAMFLQEESQNSTDTMEADEKLQQALIMFPGLLMPLLDKCSVNPDSTVCSHAFFGDKTQYSQTAALKQLVGLYIGRCHACWKQPEVVQWLERNVREVFRRVEEKDPLVEECSKKTQVRYQGTPRNILRHILISEIKDAITALPQDVANTTVLSYDPLPPLDSVSAYQRPDRQRRPQEGNTLALFLRSLLPNFNPNEPPPVNEGAEGGEEGTNLRQGVNVLMEAMRDLLADIRPVNPPMENQGEEEGEERDEGEWD
ncbi:ribosome quality control complex subunit TCF25-like [Saccostrea echinata]|uniref:ribosome quality control complex subunit TCF25-like n=1 Tax=Saccostrea echinata TaxID=191078 RepID=UPI002A7EEF23|nr:ribosome quality control complex subunit TCF25-like [Saccostrea echinata]